MTFRRENFTQMLCSSRSLSQVNLRLSVLLNQVTPEMTDRSPLPNNSINHLPLPGQRWVPSRKAAVVGAVRAGDISFEEACRRYELCPTEFNSWVATIEKHGVPSLRATRFQIYREPLPATAVPGKVSPIQSPIVLRERLAV